MIQKDRFRCNSCKYRWVTKKEWGGPSFCPNCKSKEIINVDEKKRSERLDHWNKGWKKKKRVKLNKELLKFMKKLKKN